MQGSGMTFFHWTLVGGATLLNALVSAADSAITTTGFMKGKQLLEEASGRDAEAINLWLKFPERLSAAIIISNTLIIAAMASELTSQFAHNGFYSPETWATAITLALILIFGKIIPKAWASARADRLVIVSLRFLTTLHWLLFPVAMPMATASIAVTKKFGGTQKRDRAITEEEIEYLVEEGEKAGVLEETKKEMIVSVFDLGETRVREIMTPRTAIDAVASDVSFDELMKVALETGHSRLPVYQDTIDHAVGIILVKDLLQYAHHRGKIPGDFSISRLMRAPFFVPETKLIIDVFKDLKRSKNHMAVVIDEYGGTAGIVTLEDILEEIVGEIQDEHDTEEANFVEVASGVFHVLGSTNIYEFFDHFGITEDQFTPDDLQDADTIGGFVAKRLGQLPEAGQKIPVFHLQVEVLQVTRHRVHLLAVHTPTEPVSHAPEPVES
jgi:CBS domain containing-hemolysin-like protein